MSTNTQGFGIQLAPAGFSLEANKIFDNYEQALTFVRTHSAAYEGSVISVKAPSTIDGIEYPAGVYEVMSVGAEGRIEMLLKKKDLGDIESQLQKHQIAIESSATEKEALVGVRVPEIIVYGQPVLFTIDAPEPFIKGAKISVAFNGKSVTPVGKGTGVFEVLPSISERSLQCEMAVSIANGEDLELSKVFNISIFYPPVLGNSNATTETTGDARMTSNGIIRYESIPLVFEMEGNGDAFYVGFIQECAPTSIEVYNGGNFIPMQLVQESEIPATLSGLDVVYRSPVLKEDLLFSPVIKTWKMS